MIMNIIVSHRPHVSSAHVPHVENVLNDECLPLNLPLFGPSRRGPR